LFNHEQLVIDIEAVFINWSFVPHLVLPTGP